MNCRSPEGWEPPAWAVLALVLFSALLADASAHAQESASEDAALQAALLGGDPFGTEIREHYYEVLRRSPGKAFLLDLALPGAGSVYTGLWANTIVAATLSAAISGPSNGTLSRIASMPISGVAMRKPMPAAVGTPARSND